MAYFDHHAFIASIDTMEIWYNDPEYHIYTIDQIVKMPIEEVIKIYCGLAERLRDLGEKNMSSEAMEIYNLGANKLEGTQVYNFVRALRDESHDITDQMLALSIIIDSKRNGFEYTGDFLRLEILNRLHSIGVIEDPEMKNSFGLKALHSESNKSLNFPKFDYTIVTYAKAGADDYQYLKFQHKIEEIVSDCLIKDKEIHLVV